MIPKNHLVTCLNTVGYAFGHFWKTEIFSIFFWIYSSLDPPVCTSHFFLKKKHLKTSSEQVWTLIGTVLDTLDILKFSILSIFSSLEPPGCTEEQFYRKNFLETCSKRVWLLLGTFLGILKMWKFFQLLEVVPSFDIPGCTGHFFFLESYLKTSSKHVWTILGTFLDTFEIPKLRFYFDFVPIFDPAGHDDFKKSPRNMFEHCWVRFWTFLKNWNIFDFFLNLFKSRPSSVY